MSANYEEQIDKIIWGGMNKERQVNALVQLLDNISIQSRFEEAKIARSQYVNSRNFLGDNADRLTELSKLKEPINATQKPENTHLTPEEQT